MKQLDTKKISELNLILEEELRKERSDWNEKMIELVNMLKDNKKLSEAQVYQLSYRQQIQERIAFYDILRDKKRTDLDKQTTARFREYTIGYDIKLNGTEKMAFVNADCSDLKRQVNMITAQLNYLGECIKTLDNFGFAVRNKIEILSQQLT